MTDNEEKCFCGLEMRVHELEAAIEDREATIGAYRLRELNQQEQREQGRRVPMRCQSVSRAGIACEQDNGHEGSHKRSGDGVDWSWGE